MLMVDSTMRECYLMLKLLHGKYLHIFIWFEFGIWDENDFIIRRSLGDTFLLNANDILIFH